MRSTRLDFFFAPGHLVIVTKQLPLQQAASRLQSENTPVERQGILVSTPHWHCRNPGHCSPLPWGCGCAHMGALLFWEVCASHVCTAVQAVVLSQEPGFGCLAPEGKWLSPAALPELAGCRQSRVQWALPTILGCQLNSVPCCGACLPASLSQSKSSIIKHEI